MKDEIKEKYLDWSDDVLLDEYNRPYRQTNNGKIYLSLKKKPYYESKK